MPVDVLAPNLPAIPDAYQIRIEAMKIFRYYTHLVPSFIERIDAGLLNNHLFIDGDSRCFVGHFIESDDKCNFLIMSQQVAIIRAIGNSSCCVLAIERGLIYNITPGEPLIISYLRELAVEYLNSQDESITA